jgi:hypothetical protein
MKTEVIAKQEIKHVVNQRKPCNCRKNNNVRRRLVKDTKLN